MLRTHSIALLLFLPTLLLTPPNAVANSGPQAASPRPTPDAAEQHVTVPSLPGERNKEGTVRPGGEIRTDEAGYPVNNRRPVEPGSDKSGTQAAPAKGEATRSAPRTGQTPDARPRRTVSQPVAGSTASGAPGNSSFFIKGVVKKYEPGKSIRIALSRTGRLIDYTLASDVVVPDDLRPGEPVSVRIVNQGKVRAVDRVERRGAGTKR